MMKNGIGGFVNFLFFYNLYMWNKVFVVFDMGYVMVMLMILFLIVLVLIFVNLKFVFKWVYYFGGDGK